MKRASYVLVFAAAAVLFLIGCGGASNSTNVAINAPANNAHVTPVPSATLDELASGRNVYKTNCAKCHKDNGTGGEVVIEGKKLDADDLTTAEVKKFPDDKIIRIIMNGAEDDGMPAFKNKLSEGEMRDVVKFIRAELQKAPAVTNAAPPKS